MISEAFSLSCRSSRITTAEDVVWWIRQRFVDLGLKPWFQPSVSIQRRGAVGLGVYPQMRSSCQEICCIVMLALAICA